MNNNRKKMLITGVSGLLGNNLAWYFEKKYEILGLYNDHHVTIQGIRTDGCNLLEEDKINKIIESFNPEVIIHCASLTNVDFCESDPEETRRTNIGSTENLVNAISGKNKSLVYISTDSVYDGVKGSFSEDDMVRPLNVYGETKFEGELVAHKIVRSLILRTNLFGWNILDKKSLGEWILDELTKGKVVKGFQDAVFSTIYTLELARIIDLAVQKKLTGIYNCGSSDSCSKYEFALKIADRFCLDKTLVQPISLDDFQFQATRGKNLSLDTVKLEKSLNYQLPSIDQSIDVFYRDFNCGLPSEIRIQQKSKSSISASIPYGRQMIDENDIQAVIQVLRSDRITQGPKVEEFECDLADYCRVKHAVAVNSGTAALHIACLAADVKPGDEVITSPITFVASANCALYCGAKPVFADIDSETYNVTVSQILSKINNTTQAVIPVHFAGQSCDMEAIHLAVKEKEKEYSKKIFIIEDACHALGSFYKGEKVGSCTWSDMTVMSFHPVKHITTGEGGAVLTNDDKLFNRLRKYRSHGITNNPSEFQNSRYAYNYDGFESQPVLNPWYYEQSSLGYNYRITDIQSALGLSQLKKMKYIRDRRREIVKIYNDTFKNISVIHTPIEGKNCDSNFHLYILLFDFEKIGIDRARLITELRAKGIQTQVHYIPVYLQPYYENHLGLKQGECPEAESYYSRCLTIPLFPAMTDQDIKYVIREIKKLIIS